MTKSAERKTPLPQQAQTKVGAQPKPVIMMQPAPVIVPKLNLPERIEDWKDPAYIYGELIQGEILKCVDGRCITRDGTELPADRKYLAIGTAEGIQERRDGMFVRRAIIRIDGGNELPDVDLLNARIPVEQWEIGIGDKPRPPFTHVWVVYLLDPGDASIFTYINSTGGAEAAVKKLQKKIELMRRLKGNELLCPIVLLRNEMHSTNYGKLRPLFAVDEDSEIGWVPFGLRLSSAQPATPLLEQAKPEAEPPFDDPIPPFDK
jgi:hypothetical protein